MVGEHAVPVCGGWGGRVCDGGGISGGHGWSRGSELHFCSRCEIRKKFRDFVTRTASPT